MSSRFRNLVLFAFVIGFASGCSKKEETPLNDSSSAASSFSKTKANQPVVNKKNGPANIKDQE